MKNSNKKNLLISILSYGIMQIVNILVGIFLPRLILSIYGSEVNGVVSTINSFIVYFSYLEAGLGLTLIHSLFKPLANNDIKSLNNILSFSKKQYQKISLIYFILVLCLAILFLFTQKINNMSNLEVFLLILVIGLYGTFDFYSMSKYRVLLTADRKEYILSIAIIIAQLLRFIFVWLLLEFGVSIVLVKVVPIITLVIRTIILHIYIEKKYPQINFICDSQKNVVQVNHRWDALLLQVSISTSISLPIILISQILGFKEANIYAMYNLVINAVISMISALSSGVAPTLGREIALGKNINKKYDKYTMIVTITIAVIFSTTVVMLLPFLKLYTSVVKDMNYIYPEYALLISIWGALYCYRIPITAIINAIGIYKENRKANIINIFVQLILGGIFTILFSIKGIIIVMIISALHRNLAYEIKNIVILKHRKIMKSIIEQIIIIVYILASYFFITPFFKNIIFDSFKWIVVSSGVLVVEIIISGILLIIISKRKIKDIVLLK